MRKNTTCTRRALSPAQQTVLPLRPIFDACKARGLSCTDENRAERLRAVNDYCALMPFLWLENSFKELLGNTAQIIVIADAIEAGRLTWGVPAPVAAPVEAAPSCAPISRPYANDVPVYKDLSGIPEI